MQACAQQCSVKVLLQETEVRREYLPTRSVGSSSAQICRSLGFRDILNQFMRRFAATLLLACFFAGGLTPFVQALSGVQPHACCLRRLHGKTPDQRLVSSIPARNGNCCPPLTTPHSALLLPGNRPTALKQVRSDIARSLQTATIFVSIGFSNRAPPA